MGSGVALMLQFLVRCGKSRSIRRATMVLILLVVSR